MYRLYTFAQNNYVFLLVDDIMTYEYVMFVLQSKLCPQGAETGSDTPL